MRELEKVSRLLKYHSIFFFWGGGGHIHILYIHLDTNTDYITPARACRVTTSENASKYDGYRVHIIIDT